MNDLTSSGGHVGKVRQGLVAAGTNAKQIEAVSAVLEEVLPVGWVRIQRAQDFDKRIRLGEVSYVYMCDGLVWKSVYDAEWI